MGGSVCDSLPTSIASAEIEKKHINVYPNPASNDLNIEAESNNSDVLDLKITNIEGKIFFQSTFNIKSIIDVSTFSPGVYLISLKNKYNIYNSIFTIVR